jgi:serine/threonine protein kinase
MEGTDDDPSPPEAFSSALDAGDNSREKAANLSDRGHYDSALSALDRAEQRYREALDIAQSNGRLDGSEAESRLASIDDRRREIHRERLTARLDTLREDIDRARNLTRSKHREAQERLTDLEGRIGVLDDEAAEKGLDDLREELAGLESERRTLLDDVGHSVRSGPPETIPDVPDVSVDYDALTDEEPIGAGRNADVVQATLPTPQGNIILAIKRPRMSGTLHTGTVERLLEEAETWDKLDDHDHIVGVVDYGAEPVPWIAMEYMDAGDLSDRAGELGFDQTLWTAVSITRGVRHAHRRGVAHLDLKPTNVLFREVEDAWDVPKVADWGLSKHLLEHSKSVEGLSPQYAAPEQFDDEYGATDDITDVYQLGAVFYEFFTGRPPFEGKPAKAMHRVLNEEPTPPSEVADVPEALDDVLLTALAKEKDDRYESVLYFRDALDRLRED